MGLSDEIMARRHLGEVQAFVERERQGKVALGAREPRPGALRVAVAELLMRLGVQLEYGPRARRLFVNGRGRGYGWSR
jgi:hypothetical protein